MKLEINKITGWIANPHQLELIFYVERICRFKTEYKLSKIFMFDFLMTFLKHIISKKDLNIFSFYTHKKKMKT